MNNHYKEWDRLENFHKSINAKNSQQAEGVKAFFEISKIAKKLELKVPNHLSFYVRFETNMHYDWLIRVNKLFKIILKIPNYKSRIRSFFNSDDYFESLSALYELEMALKLKLQCLEVAFTEEKAPDKTPDLEIKVGGKTFNLEVTSINNPDADREKVEFYSQLTKLRLKHNVMLAGTIIDVPKRIQNNLLQDVESKIVESKEKGTTIRLVEEGKYIIELGNMAGIGGLNSTGFHFVHKELQDIEDKVNWIIQKKSDQLKVNQNPGILCIYGGSRTFNIEELYSKSYDKIKSYLQTFPNISALVLSIYSDFYPTESFNHTKSSIRFKKIYEIKPGFGEVEQSIIWKNSIASHELPVEFLQSYEDFGQNLS